MNNDQKNKLFLYITWSHGDLLSCIPLMKKIIEKYKNTEIIFFCAKSMVYLVMHLPIKIYFFENYGTTNYRFYQELILNSIKNICPKDHTLINLWCGQYNLPHSWKNQIKTFNNQCKENNLDMYLDEEDFGFIELPYHDVDVKENAVYLESGPTQSGQTRFEFNIEKLSTMFPEINFYLTHNSNVNAHNVFDNGNQNLIYLANISRKCKMIIGKGSGPFFCTLNESNKNKIKALFGLKPEWTANNFKFWEPLNDKILLKYTEQELFELLRQVPKI